ncbi:hypothetical protein EJD97_011763 [Solanum chilense]|uniref:Uncharacterized protein n=1 Tax=Solanum chilense TaxID=4083 RepID=A0A6N2BEW6_SOLCI|nr:hypothetical protein EJD97_011763 [Solanum chilense]
MYTSRLRIREPRWRFFTKLSLKLRELGWCAQGVAPIVQGSRHGALRASCLKLRDPGWHLRRCTSRSKILGGTLKSSCLNLWSLGGTIRASCLKLRVPCLFSQGVAPQDLLSLLESLSRRASSSKISGGALNSSCLKVLRDKLCEPSLCAQGVAPQVPGAWVELKELRLKLRGMGALKVLCLRSKSLGGAKRACRLKIESLVGALKALGPWVALAWVVKASHLNIQEYRWKAQGIVPQDLEVVFARSVNSSSDWLACSRDRTSISGDREAFLQGFPLQAPAAYFARSNWRVSSYRSLVGAHRASPLMFWGDGGSSRHCALSSRILGIMLRASCLKLKDPSWHNKGIVLQARKAWVTHLGYRISSSRRLGRVLRSLFTSSRRFGGALMALRLNLRDRRWGTQHVAPQYKISWVGCIGHRSSSSKRLGSDLRESRLMLSHPGCLSGALKALYLKLEESSWSAEGVPPQDLVDWVAR